MMKLDDLKGLLSVRSINTLKWLGYEYLEEVTPDKVEQRVRGKKTKKEILDFIQGGNIMKNNNYRIVMDNDTIHILMKDKTIKLTLLDREGPYVYSKIKKEVYTNRIEPNFTDIIDSFHFNNIEIWGVKDVINIGIDEPEYKDISNWYIDKKEE